MRVPGVGAAFLSFLILAAVPAPAEVEPALSAEVGSPQKLSANLGIRIGTVKKDGADYGRGFLIQVQPGLGGGAFNVGWAPVALPSWGTQAVGLAIKARVLRTWGDPWGGARARPDLRRRRGRVGLDRKGVFRGAHTRELGRRQEDDLHLECRRGPVGPRVRVGGC